MSNDPDPELSCFPDDYLTGSNVIIGHAPILRPRWHRSGRARRMYEILKLFESKPDHPMVSADAARRILADLAKPAPAAALEQIAHWAGTLRDVDGFSCDDRFEVTAESEAAGRKRVDAGFAAFFGRIH